MPNRFEILNHVDEHNEHEFSNAAIERLMAQSSERVQELFLNGLCKLVVHPFPGAWQDFDGTDYWEDPNAKYPELSVQCNKEVYVDEDLGTKCQTIARECKCRIEVEIDFDQSHVLLKYKNDDKIRWCDRHKESVHKAFQDKFPAHLLEHIDG